MISIGCAKSDRVSDAELCFDVDFSGTKGSGYLSSQTISSFGVSSCETAQKFSTKNSTVGSNMRNEKVSKTEAGWKTASRHYYPSSGYVSFFAYAPYIGEKEICNDDNYSKGMYILTYSPPADVSKQVDFCIAKPILDKVKSKDPVIFNFEHTLSNISFAASYSGTLPQGCKLYIDKITLSGIISSGDLTYKSEKPYFQWKLKTIRNSYSVERSQSQLIDTSLKNDTITELNGQGSGGMLFLLPQTTDAQAVATVVAGLYDTNAQKLSEQTFSLPVPATQWTAGGKVKYTMTIQIEEQYSMSMKDWNSVIISGTVG